MYRSIDHTYMSVNTGNKQYQKPTSLTHLPVVLVSSPFIGLSKGVSDIRRPLRRRALGIEDSSSPFLILWSPLNFLLIRFRDVIALLPDNFRQ